MRFKTEIEVVPACEYDEVCSYVAELTDTNRELQARLDGLSACRDGQDTENQRLMKHVRELEAENHQLAQHVQMLQLSLGEAAKNADAMIADLRAQLEAVTPVNDPANPW